MLSAVSSAQAFETYHEALQAMEQDITESYSRECSDSEILSSDEVDSDWDYATYLYTMSNGGEVVADLYSWGDQDNESWGYQVLDIMCPESDPTLPVCKLEAKAAARAHVGTPESSDLIIHQVQFLGKLEVPDLLDGTESVFFESYFLVLSSDSSTIGVSVLTKEDCTIKSTSTLAHN